MSYTVRIELPPRNYFLHHLMKTSLSVIASYTNVNPDFRLHEGFIMFKNVVPDAFARGLGNLIEDIKNDVYGMRVWLPRGDAVRLKSKRGGYVGEVLDNCVSKVAVDVDCILSNYVNWFSKNPMKALDELNRALNTFRDGYLNDPGTFSALGSFLPEFVEGLRIFGATEGAQSSVKPNTALFRNIKVGVHTVFLGLLGLRISRVFYDRQRLYAVHLMPSDEAIGEYSRKVGLSSFTGREGTYTKMLRALRRLRNLASDITLLTLISIMQGVEGEVEVFELIAGANRWEILTYGVRALQPLPKLVDELKRLGDRGNITLKKLHSLIINALNNDMTDVVEAVIRSIYQGLTGVVSIGEACYNISRVTYANDDEDRHRIADLAPIDVYTLCEAMANVIRS